MSELVVLRKVFGLVVSLAAAPAAAGESPSERTVCIQPLGKHDERLLDPIAAGIRYVYGFEVRVLDGAKLPKAAYYRPRHRYRAEKLLDWLDEHVTDEACDWVVGFTGGRSCVVSSYRMKRKVKRRVVLQRAVKVAVHELGHVLGLDHHAHAGCVMNDAQGTVKTVDREDGVLCDAGRTALQKRHGLDLPERTTMDWATILR
jgi:archaemetzincin